MQITITHTLNKKGIVIHNGNKIIRPPPALTPLLLTVLGGRDKAVVMINRKGEIQEV